MAGTTVAAPESPYSPAPPDRTRGRRRFATVLGGTAVVVAAIVVAAVLPEGFDRTAGGEVAVIRNGRPFDNNRVPQVLPPASARTWIGIGSTAHRYPSAQRFHTITSDNSRDDRTGVDVENDPTSDGVEVGIEGTVYFTLTGDTQALKDFDDRYGTRTSRGLDGQYGYAWQGDAGCEAQAHVAQAKADALGNEQRQKGYSACPACAVIDEYKAIPPTITTFAPGAGVAISAPSGKTG